MAIWAGAVFQTGATERALSIVCTIRTLICTISRLKRKSHLCNLRGKGKGSLQCEADELSANVQRLSGREGKYYRATFCKRRWVLLSPSPRASLTLYPDSFINTTTGELIFFSAAVLEQTSQDSGRRLVSSRWFPDRRNSWEECMQRHCSTVHGDCLGNYSCR